MKTKLPKMFLSVLATCLLASCLMVSYADNAPIPNGSPNGATISEELDEATNKDPEMGTEFWMYLEPDPVIEDVPLMGDSTASLQTLLLRASTLGLLLIGVRYYANFEKQKEPAASC